MGVKEGCVSPRFVGIRAVFTLLSKGIGFGFTTPFGWLVYLLWFWFYDSQVKTALFQKELFAKLGAFVTIKVSLTGTNLFKMIFARVAG